MSQLSPQESPSTDDPLKVDLAVVARDLKLPPEKIETTVALLDEGNTIPFITRFRKDQTGGLDEKQILAIKQRVAALRALAERKAFVVKSIDSQGKLTDQLKTDIAKSSTSRRLEDLYLPFKPKKQSLASVARQQGLEPLADDIFNGVSPDIDIATRATDFVRVDKGLKSVDEVFKGVQDILAERFAERDELRGSLRKIIWNEGKLTAKIIAPPESESTENSSEVKKALPAGNAPESKTDEANRDTKHADSNSTEAKPAETVAVDSKQTTEPKPAEAAAPDKPAEVVAEAKEPVAEDAVAAEKLASEATPASPDVSTESPAAIVPPDSASSDSASSVPDSTLAENQTAAEKPSSESSANGGQAESKVVEPQATDPKPVHSAEAKPADASAPESAQAEAPKAGKKKKKKKKKKVDDPFKDYHDFKQALRQLPHHRVLAVNRGERAGKLKVQIDVDSKKLNEPALAELVPAEHPFNEFMQTCANDALNTTIIPGLEREIRRELTEAAENHAVEVFANNLRNLLLQPPVRNRTVMSIDPGFKRGCSVAVSDPCGNILASGHIFLVGNKARREEGKQKLINWLQSTKADVIAIGNGTACRQTEQLVSDIIGEHFQPGSSHEVRYVIVNEAGASVYSTSEIGREELPDATPSIRSAISIARRLQDPLSELVKINPASIGVGMYQHDVKAKHLSQSLDDVVEFCVNQVGVDVNAASPSLLKYVSGLNSLTARRLVEYRTEHGKFKNREELKKVSGVGDATFVQAAGFLRIHGGDTPLDSTSIHPESYGIASDILKRADTSLAELFIDPKEEPLPQPVVSTESSAEKEALPVQALNESPPATTDKTESASSETPTAETEAQSAIAETPAVELAVSESSVCETAADAAASTESSSSAESSSISTDTANESPASNEAVAEPASEPNPSESSAPATEPSASPEPAQVAAPGPAKRARPKIDPVLLAKRKEVLKRITELDTDKISQDHSAGKLMVKDILMSLKRPNWDPRGKSKKLIFRSGIIKTDDLKVEMQLDGQVVNVVDFGVFVDIGLGESSLVHVSQLSNHFVRDPHQLYAVGDVLKVWVSEIDSERRRVKLTAIRPNSKKPQGRRRKYEGKNQTKSQSGNNSSGSGRKFDDKPSGQSRGPRRKPGKYEGGHKGAGRPRGKTSYTPRPRKPKPVKPITEGMLEGKEPMRSFSDLIQFVKNEPDKKKKDKAKSKDANSADDAT